MRALCRALLSEKLMGALESPSGETLVEAGCEPQR